MSTQIPRNIVSNDFGNPTCTDVHRGGSPEHTKPRIFAQTKPTKSLRQRLNAGMSHAMRDSV